MKNKQFSQVPYKKKGIAVFLMVPFCGYRLPFPVIAVWCACLLLWAPKICAQNQQQLCLPIAAFGVTAHSPTDCSEALQKAIDSAAVLGACVSLPAAQYHFSKTLHIPSGVTLVGAGTGSNANQRPYNGTILSYTGAGTAIEITGTNTALKDLCIYSEGGIANTGLLLLADSMMVESVVVNTVLIYGFTSGTALMMEARHHGGLGYCSFYDLRIRHAKTGIHLLEIGKGSFVNSNSFFHGAVSGGGFSECLLIDGGDNNVFYGTVIEPYTSVNGHLVVNRGQIIGENIRIEATRQKPGSPVIYFGEESNLSKITGFFSGGTVINKGNNHIDFNAPNFTGETTAGGNLLVNAAFQLEDNNGLPAYWAVSCPGLTVKHNPETPLVGANAIAIAIPPGLVCDFFPKNEYAPALTAYPYYRYANFSMLVKTTVGNAVRLTYNYAGGLVASTAHTGSGNWEAIGMQVITDTAHIPRPRVHFDNLTGRDTLKVLLAAPTFNFGNVTPQREAPFLNTAGGIITGTLSTSLSNKYSFTPGTHFLTLTRNGNSFILQGSQLIIASINEKETDRFPPGTIITLLFNQAGSQVIKSNSLQLKADFISAFANTSLTLISLGDGTWREMNRNN